MAGRAVREKAGAVVPLHTYFDKTFVINLDSRPDRWTDCEKQFAAHGIQAERFPGFELHDANGASYGNHGCTHSHRELLRKIATSDWERVLVLEDDFHCLTPDDMVAFHCGHGSRKVWMSVEPKELQARFDYLVPFIPADWDLLYLGAAYIDPPARRVNKHVLQCRFMSSTASYGITRAYAQRWTEEIDRWAQGRTDLSVDYFLGAIDTIFGQLSDRNIYYCLSPRLFVQRMSRSDITGNTTTGLWAGTDSTHEEMV